VVRAETPRAVPVGRCFHPDRGLSGGAGRGINEEQRADLDVGEEGGPKPDPEGDVIERLAQSVK